VAALMTIAMIVVMGLPVLFRRLNAVISSRRYRKGRVAHI
jgi:hypothetical protein